MLRTLFLFLLVFALDCRVALASPRAVNLRFAPVSPPKPTKAPSRNDTNASNEDLKRRQVTSIGSSTCGYYNGDPAKSRTADKGYGCRLDIAHGLWGFCPTTVLSATDCGLAGNCVDNFDCKFGCGKTGIAGLTTFTCSTNKFCSTVILQGNFEGGFSYIACGASHVTETLLKDPTIAAVPSVTVTPESSTSLKESTSQPTTVSVVSTSSLSPSPSTSSASGAFSSSTQSVPPTSEATSSSGKVDESASSGGPNNTGLIIGGVVGGVAIICITVVSAVYLLRRTKSNKEPKERRTSRFKSWGRSSQKPPAYDQSEAVQVDSHLQYSTENNKIHAGWGPTEVYGSEPWGNPTAPVELPGAPPAELPGRRY